MRVEGTENSWLLAEMFHDQSGFPYGEKCALLITDSLNRLYAFGALTLYVGRQ